MKALIEMRINQGLSVRQAAKVMGIARETLATAERGGTVHPATAKTIADFYGVRVTDLWPVEEAA